MGDGAAFLMGPLLALILVTVLVAARALMKALPRAWIVHSARQVGSEEEPLDLLSADQVDPKETVLLEDAPPEMSQPDDPSSHQASVPECEANRIQLKTDTKAPGSLVLSEVYYPAWKTYIDGQPVPVRVANQLLRSVPIPAGEHTVELRYKSWTLRLGMAISLLITSAILVAVAVTALAQRWKKGMATR